MAKLPEPEDFFKEEKDPNPPTHKVTDAELKHLYMTYPELAPDENRRCKVCNRLPMRCDSACIKHTRRNMKHYEIPWMCTALKANNKRCSGVVLEGRNLCAIHYKRRGDITLGRLRATKFLLAKQAMISPNPEDWKHLLEWSCNSPKDIVGVLEETINRFRYGAITKDVALTIASLAKKILEVMTVTKEVGLNEDKPDGPKTEAWRADVNKIVSFKERLEKMVQQREGPAILEPTEEEESIQ